MKIYGSRDLSRDKLFSEERGQIVQQEIIVDLWHIQKVNFYQCYNQY